MLLALIFGGLLLLIAGGSAVQKAERQRKWRESVEAAGGIVIVAGYGGGPLPQIPVLGEFFIRRQTEVFVPNDHVAREVRPLLREYPALGRLWVHAIDVSPEMLESLSESRPDVDVVRYTN